MLYVPLCINSSKKYGSIENQEIGLKGTVVNPLKLCQLSL